MVDYSRWDKLDCSDAEEEGKKPRVQRFDAPQKVTFGGAQCEGAVEVRPSEASHATDDRCDNSADAEDEPMEPDEEDIAEATDHREYVLECRGLAERALRQGDAGEAVRLLEKAMRIGGAHCPGLGDVLASARRQLEASGTQASEAVAEAPSCVSTKTGPGKATVGDRYSWWQTKDSVAVDVFVPEATKAKDVCVSISETEVGVKVKGTPVFGGQLEFKVEVDEDPDWEMKSSDCRRAVRITLRKALLPGGLSIVTWWSRFLKGDPAIDVERIEGRKGGAGGAKFAEVWREAHDKFREQVKSREKIVVDVDM